MINTASPIKENTTTLQFFLKSNSNLTGSKIISIRKTLEKAENSPESPESSNNGFRLSETRPEKQQDSLGNSGFPSLLNVTMRNSNTSTTLSPGSYDPINFLFRLIGSHIMDSLCDEEVEPKSPSANVADSVVSEACVTQNSEESDNIPILLETGNPKKSLLSGLFNFSPSSRGESPAGSHTPFAKRKKEEDEGDFEFKGLDGFLMIKPLREEISEGQNISVDHEQKKGRVSLNANLFPSSIVTYANTIDGDSFSKYMKELILYVLQGKDKEIAFYDKRPESEALWSIVLKEDTRKMLREVLEGLGLKLKEESVSFQLKYKEEIEYIKTILDKVKNELQVPIKLEEKELRALDEKVNRLGRETHLIVSHSALRVTEKLLTSISNKPRSPVIKQCSSFVLEYSTLPKLLEKSIMNDSDDYLYRDVLFYTYDLYITPTNLILYLIFRYFMPKSLNMTPTEREVYNREHISKTKVSIISLMIFWMEERSTDFLRTPSLLTIMNAFLEVIQLYEKEEGVSGHVQKLWVLLEQTTQRVIKTEKKVNPYRATKRNMAQSVNKMQIFPHQSFMSISTEIKKPRKISENIYPIQLSIFAKPVAHKTLYSFENFLKTPIEDIAQQLTLLDWKLFSQIEPRELLKKRWTKQDKRECPNYWAHVTRFNTFSYWIQYVILSQENLKKRTDLVERFLSIAIECIRGYKNYSSPNYIFSALFSLHSFGILSMEHNQSKSFEELKRIYVPTKGYIKQYNELFKDLDPPAVPDLNVFLKIFLKLQEEVKFMVPKADSELKYIKFQLLVQVHDYCKDMKKFQRNRFQTIPKAVGLYKFLKNGFREGLPVDFNNSEESMQKIVQMVGRIRKRID